MPFGRGVAVQSSYSSESVHVRQRSAMDGSSTGSSQSISPDDTTIIAAATAAVENNSSSLIVVGEFILIEL